MARMFLIRDMKSPVREAWVGSPDEFSEAQKNYSGWAATDLGDVTEEEAERIRQNYVDYVGEPDVVFSCCDHGCSMSARDYAYMQGFFPACKYDDDDDWDE